METDSAPTPADPAPPGWTEVRVDAPLGTLELVAEALRPHPGAAVQTAGPATPPAPEGTSAVRTYLAPREDGPGLRETLERRLGRLAESTGLRELQDLQVCYRSLPAADWAALYRASWKPFRVGHLCVVPPWTAAEAGTRLRPDDVPLRLEPGGVFGTGRHPSTRTCLRELQSLPVRGTRILDAGTGTGILAVAAGLLGARRVEGFDVDPDSVGYAESLARDNGLEPSSTGFATAGFEHLATLQGGFDGVLANIYHDVLQAHSGDLAAALAPGGWFVFSGIHRRHREATRAAVEAAGLAIERDLRSGNWCTLVGTRMDSPT